MKKLVLIIVITLVVLLSLSALAEEVKVVTQSGEIKLIEQVENTHPITPEEERAEKNPGQEIPIGGFSIKYNKVDFLHITLTKTYTQVLVFKDSRIQIINKVFIVEGKPFFAFSVACCLVAIGCMLLSTLFMLVGKDNVATFAAFAAAAVSIFAVIAPAAAAAAAAVAVIVAAIAFAAIAVANNRLYWIASILFCICIITAMFI